MSKAGKSILGGVTVLSIAGLICKVVGALYRVPLSYIMGEEGMATYQLVFPTYNMLLQISMAGLPVAISQMISGFLSQDDPRSAKRTFRIATVMLTALGLITMLIMLIFSPQLAARTGDPATQPGFTAIAPALLLVCVMSALRGFMQGQQHMTPTAVSQLIEQVGKVFICLPMAYFGMRISVAYAAAGMLLGTSVAEGVALVYMYIVYRKRKNAFDELPQAQCEGPTNRELAKRLIALSVPTTIGAMIVPLSQFIDSGMVLGRMLAAGYTMEAAKPLYGCYSGYVLTLINVPTAFATSIAMSLVPSVSHANARHDLEGAQASCTTGLRIACIVALPCSIGMSMLGQQILSLIYHFDSAERLITTGQIMGLSGLTVILFTLEHVTAAILQGLGKVRVPMYTLGAGVVVKIILNYVLIGTPGIGLFGAPIASLCCYMIALIPNLICVRKYIGIRYDWLAILLKPLVASLGMGAVLYAAIRLLPQGRLWTLVLVALGAAVYAVLIIAFKAVTREETDAILRRVRRKR